MKKALLLGVKLSRLSKVEAEKEMKRILVVSKIGARHAKALVGKAYVVAGKEKRSIVREVKAELKKSKPTKRKVPAKRKTAKRRKR